MWFRSLEPRQTVPRHDVASTVAFSFSFLVKSSCHISHIHEVWTLGMGRRRGVAALVGYLVLIATLCMLYKPAPSRKHAKVSTIAPNGVNISRLHVTYENCIAGLPHDRSKKLRKLLWLHFPKCGTSLGTVVHGYLCQSDPTPHSKQRTGRRTASVCDYCELEQMNKQGTPYWDGKIRALLPTPEIRKYCDWNVSPNHVF